MTTLISERTKRIKPSPTLAVTAKANELRAAGQSIIALGAGEPDFDTPDHIKQAAMAAIQAGFTKYTAVDGIPELKDAIVKKFSTDNELHYHSNQILVSSGGKQSFFNLAQALLNDGDEVIIPTPYWVSYPDMVALAGGIPVFIQTDISQNFKITADQLAKSITSKTKLVVLNSPSNPSGVAYTRAELQKLGEVLVEHPSVMIASDDMYEHILWSEHPFSNIVMASPSLTERTIVLNGVSKAYSMTGWRIGYAAGPQELITAMKKVQSQSTSNPCSISQKAAVAALNGEQNCVKTMVTAFKERHDFIVQAINQIPGLHCLPSDGAFYAFVNAQAAIETMSDTMTDVTFAEELLSQVGVAVVPGSAFGCPGYIRLSFATSLDNLKSALEKIAAWLK